MMRSESRTRILIVEDESIVAMDMRNRLNHMGFEVVGLCDTADKAVELATTQLPDCILMDIKLKGDRDGVQAAEQIQRILDIPVIYITAFADEKTLARAKITQAFGYILKPFQEREVLIAIEMAIYKHHVERELRENREWLDGSLQGIADAVLALDAEDRLVFMNRSAEQLLGLSGTECIGLPLDRICSLRSEDGFESGRSWHGGNSGQDMVTLKLSSAAGSRPVSLVQRPIVNRLTGAERGKVLALRDITETLAAERTRSRLASIVSNSYDAILAVDGDLTIVSWNFGAEGIYGYTASEVVGKSLLDLIPDERDRLSFRNLAAHVLSGKDIGRIESRRRCRSGKTVSVSVSLSPVRNAEGKVMELSCIERDISAEKEYEASLIKAKSMAEEANRAKSEFLSNMSHELRTPLNSIIGMIELTRELAAGDEQREYLEIARQSAGNLLFLINSILDFSKIESGKMHINVIPMDLIASASECLENISVQAGRKGLDLLFRFDPSFPVPLLGDVYRLQQILMNLLSNAVKFTEKGQVRLDISFRMNESGDIAVVRMAVSDTGIGIAPERFGDIWEQFTQLDASSTRANGGTGLGLAIVKSLSELMGGTAGVRSTLNVGSVFTVELPLAVPAEAQRAVEPRPELQGRRVGFAIESPEERDILSELIGAWGCEALALKGADDVITLFRSRTDELPHVVFVDDRLPDRHLLYTCEEDENCLEALRSRLIVLAGVGVRDEAGWRLLSEKVRFLIKPLRKETLFKALLDSPVLAVLPVRIGESGLSGIVRLDGTLDVGADPGKPQPGGPPPLPSTDAGFLNLMEEFLRKAEALGRAISPKLEYLVGDYRRAAEEQGAQDFSKALFKLLLACRRLDQETVDAVIDRIRTSVQNIPMRGRDEG